MGAAEVAGGAAEVAEPAALLVAADEDALRLLGEGAAALEAAGALPGAGAASAVVGEQLGEVADVELAFLLQGDGLLGPVSRIGEGGEEEEDGVGEVEVADGAAGGNSAGDAGVLEGAVVREAGSAEEAFEEPALPVGLDVVEEIAELEGEVVAVGVEIAEGGEVGEPAGVVLRVVHLWLGGERVVRHGQYSCICIMAEPLENWRLERRVFGIVDEHSTY
jgi:hypothetical protein